MTIQVLGTSGDTHSKQYEIALNKGGFPGEFTTRGELVGPNDEKPVRLYISHGEGYDLAKWVSLDEAESIALSILAVVEEMRGKTYDDS